MFIFNILAFGFTLTSLIKTAKYHGKAMFELIPLSINTIATLILLFLKLFEKGYDNLYLLNAGIEGFGQEVPEGLEGTAVPQFEKKEEVKKFKKTRID